MDGRHQFQPSADDARICGFQVARGGGPWGGQTCGLRRSNAAIHAPGASTAAEPQPDRQFAVIQGGRT